ncbi:Transmembrane protein 97 [Mactra antiquata]
MDRLLDFIYLLYFGSHIPIALFADSQAALPAWLYPQQLKDVMDWYTSEYKDSMMKAKPAWFQSFIFCEIFLQFPFFFVAFYAYFKGVSKNKWIRIPMIVYSTHVVTSLLCIYFHLFLHDFSGEKVPGPQTMQERLTLASFYFPYFIVPVILLIDALFHPIYTQKTASPVSSTKSKGGKKRKQY